MSVYCVPAGVVGGIGAFVIAASFGVLRIGWYRHVLVVSSRLMMTNCLSLLLLCVAYCAPAWSQNEHSTRHPVWNDEPPVFRLSFRRNDKAHALSGFTSIAPSYQCTSDGTLFFLEVHQPSMTSLPVEVLVSESLSGELREFRFDQINDLHDIQLKAHYAADSTVILLVVAATEEKRERTEFTIDDGSKHEMVENTAEHHDFILVFDRSGQFTGRVEIDDSFAVQRVGVFPSGDFLIYGFDKQNHAPKLAMLRSDGTLMRMLEIPKNSAPNSVFTSQTKNGPTIFIRPVQFVSSDHSILVVQHGTRYPLLEVNEAGVVRAIRPRLPREAEIESLIPSDHNLFLQTGGSSHSTVYEINKQDGRVVRKVQLQSQYSVGCVHDNNFLSFERKKGEFLLVVGTAEPVTLPRLTQRETR